MGNIVYKWGGRPEGRKGLEFKVLLVLLPIEGKQQITIAMQANKHVHGHYNLHKIDILIYIYKLTLHIILKTVIMEIKY